MSNSVRPQRWQPTRLRCPRDSPGKNTRVGCHFLLQCMKVKSESEVTQSCLTLCDPMDCSLLGCSVHGIFQARVLEWGAIAFSIEWHVQCACLLSCFSHVRLLATPWTAAHQAPLSMGFSRQEYWSGVPLPSPELIWGYFKYQISRKDLLSRDISSRLMDMGSECLTTSTHQNNKGNKHWKRTLWVP